MNPTESTTLEPVPPHLLDALRAACGSVSVRASQRLAAAHDASHYLVTPQAVVTPKDASEVASVLGACRAVGASATFRSGGTSLSGQAGGGGVLLDTRRNFRSITVLDGGARVRTGPGATVRQVNNRLARFGRKLGPDPASEIAATVGGVVANNSSGMSCGTEANTYRTLDSTILVLPSGTVIDTGRDDADEFLRTAEPGLYDGLIELRDRVRADTDSVATITELYSIKNTMGYGLNSFVDFDRPVDILEHLVVGSEGTLAFVAEATFRTVPVRAHAATGLLVFVDLAGATAALPALVDAGPATIELLDATSLRVAQRNPEATAELLALTVEQHAALLVEFQDDSAEALQARVALSHDVLERLPLVTPAALATDAQSRAQLWHIRKGLFTAVAGNRPTGTTALLEDIAVPVERLRDTCEGLTRLFERHRYQDSVIFGHAKDGNIHFMINERFDDPGSLARYEAFTRDLVGLVLSHRGTLKAEHGTGRIMAPFVRQQYGHELHAVMRQVKALLDPSGLLNPGVLLTDDDAAHVRDLKTSPSVEAEVDRCVECGYCEPVCPSRDLTTTPRERIVLRREIERAREADDNVLVAELEQDYQYDAVETCAVDGMCQTACPVLINTGDLVRRLRAETSGAVAGAAWKSAAAHWDAASRIGGIALGLAKAVPAALPVAVTSLARSALGAETVPRYDADLPAGGSRRPQQHPTDPVAIYFSSCTTTMFGPADGASGVTESLQRLCERAGIAVSTPPGLPALCCGTPWKSKGFTAGYQLMKTRVAMSLRSATRGGALPVISDASSCTEGLQVLLEAAEASEIRVIDAVEFVDEYVLPRLNLAQLVRLPSLSVHPTCSSTRLGANPALLRVASAVAEDVSVPEGWGCCAFAGDRGMLHPELTASATAAEATEVRAQGASGHVSLNRTCELGLTRATGQSYRHILEVLDEVVASTEEAH